MRTYIIGLILETSVTKAEIERVFSYCQGLGFVLNGKNLGKIERVSVMRATKVRKK